MAQIWREDSYEAFADGTFGNGGQNIYCSRDGILQRIFHFDVNADGYVDLLFVNAQDMNERVPLHLYSDPFGACDCIELPTQGAFCGAAGDLSGNGWDDLVVGNQHNGVHGDVCSYVYFAGPDGSLSEERRLELHAPCCRSAAVGDFYGSGRPAIAFATQNTLRIFPQREHGFDATHHHDIEDPVTHLAAADLDGDGYCDLFVRIANEKPRIFWGGPAGIDPARHTIVGGDDPTAEDVQTTTASRLKIRAEWKPAVLSLNGHMHVYRQEEDEVRLYPISADRSLGTPICLQIPNIIKALAADLDGDGNDDLVLLCARDLGRAEHMPENSLVLWGDENGFDHRRATTIPTVNARDAVAAQFSGAGQPDLVIAQGSTEKFLTTESLLLRFEGRQVAERTSVTSHDAAGVFALTGPAKEPPRLAILNHEGGRVRGDVTASLYWGGPDGYQPDRRQSLPSWAAPDGICCDFNNDGRTDVLIANCAENAPHLDPGSFLFWQDKDGFDPERRFVFPTIRAHGSAVGDFRHTGYLDIAFGGFANPELVIYRGGPDGYHPDRVDRIWLDPDVPPYAVTRTIDRTESRRGVHYNQVRWLLACDFNGDGWLDLFVSQIAGRHCFILWGGPEGFSTDRMHRLYADGVGCANAADLTGNGWPDLVLGSHNSRNSKSWEYESNIFIYWGGPNGFSEFRRTQLPVHTCNSLAIADFNNDGMLDIFATCYHGGRSRDVDSFLYWNRPGRGFSLTDRTQLPSHSACGCVAADFNEDGWVDLAVACHKTHGNHQGQSQIWWNGPDGFNQKRVDLLPTDGPHGMTAVDPGNILTRGPDEFYMSNLQCLPENAQVRRVGWQAHCPPKTRVRMQLRSGTSAEDLLNAGWQGPEGPETWFETPGATRAFQQHGQWIQYRLALGAVNGGQTPRVRAVEIAYDV